MKKYAVGLFLTGIMLISSSCVYIYENSISGDGNVITEKRTVDDFHGIHAASGLKVYVNFGEMSNEIEIEADENLQEYIITKVENGVLIIKSKRNIRNATKKRIYVQAGEIEALEASSAANLVGENLLEAEDLEVEVSSAGNLSVIVEAETIDLEASSSGHAVIEGIADKMYAEVSSAGSLDAYELELRDCDIEVSSAGNARIFVTGELRAEASSAGNVRYRGNPERKDIRKSSAGSISGD